MWSRIPLVRLIIPLIAGILLSELIFPGGCSINLVFASGLAVVAGTFFYSILFGYRRRWLFGLLIINFFFLYASHLITEYQEHEVSAVKQFPDSTQVYVGLIEEAFQLRERSCKGTLKMLAVETDDGLKEVQGSMIIYTVPDSTLPHAEPGSVMLIYTHPEAIRSPLNPGEFDYKEYLRKKGIYHSAFLKEGDWLLTEKRDAFNLMARAEGMRRKLLQKLTENGIEKDHFGVSAALLLGDDAYLDDQLRDMYARAGAMHILCVSGLHVGVIFLVLNTLFGFLRFLPAGKILLPAVLIISIWMYALITGLAPPVMRASIMISFIILGDALQRHKNVYNTLSASAFLLLLFNPYILYSAGFQLSYTAVLGIVSLQRPIYNLVYCKYSLPDKLWAITTVSIAAQLGTLPVVLYYFHQYPVYSLLTNLLVIPLSSLIIYNGLFLFFMPSGTQLSVIATQLLDAMILLMDQGIMIIEKLPYAVIKDISIDKLILFTIYIMIISISLLLISKKKQYLFIFLMAVLFLSAYHFYQGRQISARQKFIVYSLRGHSAYNTIAANEHILYCDSSLLQSQHKISYSIKPHWLELGLHEPETVLLSNNYKHEKAYGNCQIIDNPFARIAVWTGRLPSCHPPDTMLKLDLLILRGRCPFEAEDLLKWFDPGIIIFDSSVPPWVKVPEGDERYWSVVKKGAYVREY